jgi:alpha-L-rhamnosidase
MKLKLESLNCIILPIVVIFLSFLQACSWSDEIPKIYDMQCEYLNDPLGIDTEVPRLSWKLNNSQSTKFQKSYHILVASDSLLLKKNIGDLWDTGTINSDQSINIKYEGKNLLSRQKAFWKVRISDQNNILSGWSKISNWEMGLIDETDWSAKWIGKEELGEVNVGENKPAIYLRKNFNIQGKIKQARIYISGLGYYELYINGRKVGDHVLSPNQTNYDKRRRDSYENGKIANMSTRVLYETFNLENHLQVGENVIAVVLGNGWYFQNEREEYLPLQFNTPRLISQLEVEDIKGIKTLIISDNTWKLSQLVDGFLS